MKRPSLASLAAASLVLLCPAPAFSQAQPPAATPATLAPVPTEKRFDIQLDGGIPAQEAVGRISEKLKQPVNVIFTGDSADTPLPMLRLHQVTLSEFFAAVQAAGQIESQNGRAGYNFAPVEGAPNIYTFSVQSPPQPDPNAFTSSGLVVASNFGGANAAAPAPQKVSLFFDLSTILNQKLTIEDITTAIRTAWTAAEDGKEPPPEALKFHQETKLLIATGFPSRLETVKNIVSLLQDRNRPSKDDQQREINEVVRQREETERQKNREVAEAADQYERMAKKLDLTEKEKNEQIEKLRSRLAELEIELAKAGIKR